MSTTDIHRELMEFIIRKAENIKSPFKISQLINGFKREYKRMDSADSLRHKIETLRSKIPELEGIETEMKVKMLFGLHAPVDPDFLEKLKVNADSLKLDEFQRIIEYTDTKRGLELKGRHQALKARDETTDKQLLKFLVEKSKNVDAPLVGNSFLREFKSLTRNSSSLKSLKFRLQKDATVVVDEKGRITKYEGNDGSLILKGDQSNLSKMKLSLAERWNSIRQKIECGKNKDSDTDSDNNHGYEREMSQLIKFVIERAKSVNMPMNIRSMCEDFKRLYGSSNKLSCLYMRVRNFGEKICRMNEFDISVKVRTMFALSTRVSDEFLNELRKDAVVQVDSLKRIIKYQANDGTLSLEGEHSISAKRKLASVARRNKIAARAENDEVTDEEAETERKKMKATKRKTPETENGKRSRVDLLKNVSEFDEDESETSPDESDESYEPEETIFSRSNEEFGRDQNVSSSTNDYRAQYVGNLNTTLGSTVGNEEDSDEEILDNDEGNVILKTKAGKILTHKEYDRGAEFDYEDLIQITEQDNLKMCRNQDVSSKYSLQNKDVPTVSPAMTDGDQEYVKRGLKSERFSKKRSLNAGTSSKLEMEEDGNMTNASPSSAYSTDKKNMIITEELYIVSPDGEDLVEETTESTDSVFRKTQQDPTSSITVHPINKSDYRVPFNQKPSKELSNYASSSSSEVVKKLIQPKLYMKTERLDKINDNFQQKPTTEKKCEKGFQNTVRAGKLRKSSNIRLDDRQVSTSSFVNSRKKSICVESESIGNPTKTHNQIPTEPPLKVCKVETTSCDLEVIAIVNAGHEGIEGSVESLEGFLKLLRAHVSMLNSRSLDDFEIKIDYLTTTLGDKPISIDNIRVSLETCFLSLAQKGALKSPPGEETKSLRNLMVSLKTITCYFRHSSLNSFKEKLENFINGLFVKDKRITIDEVRSALERALDFVTL
ncbi:hypothetical protein GCK72_019812 [Caenorhabditis remanei]|uniref:SPK domain-containing protein n=1 Tax=Caenorhabditis remanei TaxID=31234 RepID=A0A6A5GEY0_CAERE|nr:hypothetical protein GCK72_019811 [Caenorhabditis remanei]XP_053582154.1 hypothetical protein GCK72_019812 [Caenorhabditis remanei]KAF1753255.1 hypothetical protein GCK72_019811 [Caenorhabditis remanei]KAF1753256.1 hypothetical protein GCK72_019812 [Caenorhabditis remanei]